MSIADLNIDVRTQSRNLAVQRTAIADLLASEWVAQGMSRAWHAVYYVSYLDEWRSAIILQRRGVAAFQVGIVREVNMGGSQELKSAVLTTIEACIWLGLHLVDIVPAWELAL